MTQASRSAGKAARSAAGVLGDIAANAQEGFRRAAADATSAAERTAPMIRQSLAKSVYMLAYGLSFGVVYTAEVALELMPEDGVLRQGFRDGAEAAREARASHHHAGGHVAAAAKKAK